MSQACQCTIVGAGPAGLSFLIALCNRITTAKGVEHDRLQALLDSTVILEATASAGGIMGDYQINANTDSVDVVQGIDDQSPFADLRDQYLKLPETRQALIPLPVIGDKLIKPLAARAVELLGDRLRFNAAVSKIVVQRGEFNCLDSSNQSLQRSKQLLLCSGGNEVLLPELNQWREKTEFAGDFLRRRCFDQLTDASGRLVIVGASHSGFSVAWRFLNSPQLVDWIDGREIIVLHRGQPIKMRGSTEFAAEHQMEYDPNNDVCPTTGLVFRHAGLRKDAKSLYLKIRDGKEKRIKLVVTEKSGDQDPILDEAALIVQCTGFQTNFPDLLLQGKPCQIDPNSKQGELRVAGSGEKIPGLYGMGLGMRVPPQGSDRGEKSFDGSVNGMLSYPLALAPEIINLMQAEVADNKLEEAR